MHKKMYKICPTKFKIQLDGIGVDLTTMSRGIDRSHSYLNLCIRTGQIGCAEAHDLERLYGVKISDYVDKVSFQKKERFASENAEPVKPSAEKAFRAEPQKINDAINNLFDKTKSESFLYKSDPDEDLTRKIKRYVMEKNPMLYMYIKDMKVSTLNEKPDMHWVFIFDENKYKGLVANRNRIVIKEVIDAHRANGNDDEFILSYATHATLGKGEEKCNA